MFSNLYIYVIVVEIDKITYRRIADWIIQDVFSRNLERHFFNNIEDINAKSILICYINRKVYRFEFKKTKKKSLNLEKWNIFIDLQIVF